MRAGQGLGFVLTDAVQVPVLSSPAIPVAAEQARTGKLGLFVPIARALILTLLVAKSVKTCLRQLLS